MNWLNKAEWVAQINLFDATDIPYFFAINFETDKAFVSPIDELEEQSIYFNFGLWSNEKKVDHFKSKSIDLKYKAIPFEKYKLSYNLAQEEIHFGNSYLMNLCARSSLGSELDLMEIFKNSKAQYRLLFKDYFTVFSPEPFIKIENGIIKSFPMKGTRIKKSEADIELLRQDKKERAEHFTIVDLIRNDLGIVCDKVWLERFAFIEEIKKTTETLLQMSSEIAGNINAKYIGKTGDLLAKILPAGSISGAPKKKTIEIIKRAETTDRGFYTGVMGAGRKGQLETAVMIRFIEKDDKGNFYYKTGGGLTFQSDIYTEYDELHQKIYVPTI